MKSIIVGTDFSKGSYVALELAIDVANKLETDIKIVWAKREKKLIDEEHMQIMTHLAEEKLQSLCDQYRDRLFHGKLRWEVVPGKVATAIAEQARQENAPMIIIGTNGASGFEKYWMGSTAVRIVQESPCPVLTIREGFNFHKALERIVVPIRTNVSSRQKVPPAVSMARMFGATVHILGLSDSSSAEQNNLLRSYMRQTAEYCEKEGVESITIERSYKTYSDTLLDYAEEINADLLVINTEQDRIISQLFLGTNAQQIVHKSQFPVLCIHPADIFNFAK